jgi:hypothetical protein
MVKNLGQAMNKFSDGFTIGQPFYDKGQVFLLSNRVKD